MTSDLPLAMGFMPGDYLDWALAESEALKVVNCRLYEAAKLNASLADKEPPYPQPIYCKDLPKVIVESPIEQTTEVPE